MLFWKRCSVSVVKVLKYCSWAFCCELLSWSTSTLLQKPYLLKPFLAKVLTFISFLEELLVKQYPTKRVVLVMDNASFIKCASALAALSLFEHRVMVCWLPPYCSDLNPIELFWRYLKDHACANKLQANIDEVVNASVKLMTAQNCQSVDPKFHISKDL